MDVVFVDVGFGSCSVILTGSGEAIVIDAGERMQDPLLVLNSFSVKKISHLIVSHWDNDHVGGASGILKQYLGKIGTVWFPFDPKFKKTCFWELVIKERKAGRLSDGQFKSLFVENITKTIWESLPLNADLKIVSPCFMENNEGAASGDSNSTCGILLLRVGTKLMVFAGDATLRQWEKVPARIGGVINAEVISVPHHAGVMWPSHWNANQIANALDLLYSQKVIPAHAIISASTLPGKKHPRADVIGALKRANVSVMCTQMTSRCTSDLEAVRTMRKSLPMSAPGRSSPTEIRTKRTNKSYEVACAGSVFVELTEAGASIRHLAAHQDLISSVPNNPGKLPLCKL